MEKKNSPLKVGIAGLGVIGLEVAKTLDAGIPGLQLAAVAVRDRQKAARAMASFRAQPEIVTLDNLSEDVDVVVECIPAAVFDQIAWPAVKAGRILISMSSAALLTRPEIFTAAEENGAYIIVPSGGMLGFDAIRAAAEGTIHSVKLITRKPPESLAGAPYLASHNIELSGITDPMLVFKGSAYDAAKAFPANVNVAATLSLAGIGPKKTMIEVWAVPGLEVLEQEVEVLSDSTELRMNIKSYPMPENPRTGSLTPKSTISALRSLVLRHRFGS